MCWYCSYSSNINRLKQSTRFFGMGNAGARETTGRGRGARDCDLGGREVNKIGRVGGRQLAVCWDTALNLYISLHMIPSTEAFQLLRYHFR